MVQLIKKGGLRERANRSRKYSQSENSIKTLDLHRYTVQEQTAKDTIKNTTSNHIVQPTTKTSIKD